MSEGQFEIDKRAVEEVFPEIACPIEPTGNKVLVQLRRIPTKTQGGIHLSSGTVRDAKYDEVIAKVIKVGPLAYTSRDEEGQLVPWAEGAWTQVGDLVRVIKYGGDRWSIPFEDDYIHYIIIHDKEVIAKIPSYDDARSMASFY